MRAFYAASLLWITRSMSGWPGLLQVDAADPQWPARWLDAVGLERGIPLILIGYVLAGIVVAILPQWRPARLAYFLLLLQYMALENGFGKINHGLHAWLFVSGLLVLLPSRRWPSRRSIAERHYFLSVFVACQLMVLFFYTLTGLWKVFYNVEALINPAHTSSLHFSGFSRILASRILETNQDTLLGEIVVRNEIVGWALFNATMYLEGASVLIAFRPRLHRPWGFGLILVHMGTQLTMGFTFPENILLVGLLLVCSPIAPDRMSINEAVLDLPGIHLLSRRWKRLAAARGPAWNEPRCDSRRRDPVEHLIDR